MLHQGLRELLNKVDQQTSSFGKDERGDRNGARPVSQGRGQPGRGRSANRSSRLHGQADAADGGRLAQPGDWTCPACLFCPNFARRRDCYRCKRPRSPRGGSAAPLNRTGGAGDATRGPVGAGGQRPLLGRPSPQRGTATDKGVGKGEARPPSFRVPGASIAANAPASTGTASWLDAAKRAPQGGGATTARPLGPSDVPAQRSASASATTDAEGFQEVTRRKGRKPAAATTEGGTARDDEVHDDEGARKTDTGGTDGEGAQGDGDEGPEQPTVADLQRAWQDEQALVKRLRGQGLQDDHPVMLAAIEARDAAEQAWRSSKEPAPASVRLGRAQAKLDRAVALQADARSAMLATEREYRERMSAHQATMAECADRVRWRRQQLREIQEEVGAGGPAAAGAQRMQQEAIRRVHEAITGEVGPTIAALIEQLDTEAPAWAALNGLLGTLAASKSTLEQATTQTASQYHIGEEDEQKEWGEALSDWSESHDVQGQRWGNGHASNNGGHDDDRHDWGRGRTGWGGEYGQGTDDSQPMDTDDWWGMPARRWGGTTRWEANGHGKWTRSSWADQLEDEGDDDDDGGDEQRPTARRRVGPAASEQATGDACDPEEQRRRHEARVERITVMAIDAGVSPLTADGEELRLLDQPRLDAWIAEFLPAALLC